MKSNVRTRRSWLTNIPIGLCIFFIVIGLLLGNVFVIVTWHQGRLIEKSEAIPIVAMFDSYVIHTSSKGSLNEVELRFGDYGKCKATKEQYYLLMTQKGELASKILHLAHWDCFVTVWPLWGQFRCFCSGKNAGKL